MNKKLSQFEITALFDKLDIPTNPKYVRGYLCFLLHRRKYKEFIWIIGSCVGDIARFSNRNK
jgi:hypothetical protein